LAASGGTGTLTWVDYDGGLAGSGLVMNAAGQVQGTPTVAGPINFTARVTDVPGASDDQALSFTINPALQITTTSPLPGWQEDEPGYSVTLASTGGTVPLTWSNPGGGLSGTGLTLATNGTISGTPTNAGTINFAARVVDQAGASHNRDFQIDIYAGMTIMTLPTLSAWTVGQPGYSQILSAIGGDGDYTWSDLNGDLAGTGLGLAPEGVLSGTPNTSGLVSFIAYVADGSGQDAQRELHLTVNPWPQFDGDTVLTAWTVDHPGYAANLATSGGTGAKVFTTQSFNGLSLSALGQLTGTPDTEGELVFTAAAHDQTGAAISQTFVVPVNPRPAIDTETLPEWTLGHSGYNELLLASGGTGALSFTAQSFDGLSLAASGYLTGTPNATGGLNFTAEVVDAVGATEQKALAVYVNDAVAITTDATLPEATENDPSYSALLEATGGTGSVSWSDDGGLSGSGLVLSAGGEVSGTPSIVGPLQFTGYATDAVGAEDSRLFSIMVIQAWICGDANADDVANITDATYLITYIFADGPEPVPYESGDADCDEVVNITDAVYLIAYIFADGPEPCANCSPAGTGRPGSNLDR
ncbi:MAG: putative Ig domain-containing protein, partial [bacterium]